MPMWAAGGTHHRVVSAALRLRNGTLLPSGRSAEEIDAQRDFWTYATILAALLHDVGKPMADLRIELIDRRADRRGAGCRSPAISAQWALPSIWSDLRQGRA